MLRRDSLSPKDRICLALDVADTDAARHMLDQVRDHVGIIKIGYKLGFAGGLKLIEELVSDGVQVFADFKLHDIDNTVKEGVASLSKLGVAMLTVHAYPKTMRAAQEGRPDGGPVVLGVTVLTSMDDQDMARAGYVQSVAAMVESRAVDASKAGMQGLVCSAKEARMLRSIISDDMLLVTPGIRPAGSDTGDQKRIMTPEKAVQSGADILVIGRPILQADNPADAAKALVDEVANAL